MHHRQNALNKWLKLQLDSTSFTLSPLAGDASFRRYFRLYHSNKTQIVMDAPPEQETLQPFIVISALLREVGVHAPRVHAQDSTQGFAILDDFGDILLLNRLSVHTAEKLYETAIATLISMQNCHNSTLSALPRFDYSFIMTELTVFREWFLDHYLKLQLSVEEKNILDETFDWLAKEIIQQPQVFIHRDYHSRNIMLLDDELGRAVPKDQDNIQLGIIDFQDAMQGPLTYDLVSLLKDCYIQWSQDQVIQWASRFYEKTSAIYQWSFSEFICAFNLCGLQRHLKVLGVFSRLHIRDKKSNYLQDLPLTLHYAMQCLESYKELESFYQFMKNRVCLPDDLRNAVRQ